MKKYTVYENDLKFKNMRNIDPNLADWYNDDLKNKFNKDFDSVSARLKMCEANNFIYLDLSRLDLEKIPKLVTYSRYKELTKIKYLFLNDNKLTSCGKRLEDFIDLEVLDISYNFISEITFLPNKLKEFVCNNNKLIKLPSHESIEILDCMTNKIQTLGHYPKLKDLVCIDNNLNIIISYNLLKRLLCKQNLITEICPQPNLEQLDCSETKLVGKLSKFPKLTGLICNFTEISNISELINLESLEIVGCKMNVPYLKKLKCLLCDNSEENISVSDKFKLANVISEGSSICCIFESSSN